MDLSKAFESVCHSKLINYLDKIGIKHKALNLSKSYFDHRIHKVQIDNVKSSCKTMTLEVPQGTVLSPILFIIYVRGLSNLLVDGSLYSYADDTAIASEAIAFFFIGFIGALARLIFYFGLLSI